MHGPVILTKVNIALGALAVMLVGGIILSILMDNIEKGYLEQNSKIATALLATAMLILVSFFVAAVSTLAYGVEVGVYK